MIRHPKGKKQAGKSSDYYASTHDVAPTILGSLGIKQPQPMEGADLTPLLDGKQPDQKREHFTLAYHDHVSARDGDYVMVSLSNGIGRKAPRPEQRPAHERGRLRQAPRDSAPDVQRLRQEKTPEA